MTFTRSFRQMLCRVLIGTLLFAQFALAAYACPGTSFMAAAHATGSSDAGMAMPCADMDKATPNLCAEHCRHGQQAADHAPVLMPMPALFSLLYALPPAVSIDEGAASTLASPSVASTGAAPPLAILHCRWRI